MTTHTHTHTITNRTKRRPKGISQIPNCLDTLFCRCVHKALGYVMRGPRKRCSPSRASHVTASRISLGVSDEDRNTLTCRSWPHAHCCYLAPALSYFEISELANYSKNFTTIRYEGRGEFLQPFDTLAFKYRIFTIHTLYC